MRERGVQHAAREAAAAATAEESPVVFDIDTEVYDVTLRRQSAIVHLTPTEATTSDPNIKRIDFH